ncbi:hypothetical protein Droror1_Dr00008976 [Drosera rotundifolia]
MPPHLLKLSWSEILCIMITVVLVTLVSFFLTIRIFFHQGLYITDKSLHEFSLYNDGSTLSYDLVINFTSTMFYLKKHSYVHVRAYYNGHRFNDREFKDMKVEVVNETFLSCSVRIKGWIVMIGAIGPEIMEEYKRDATEGVYDIGILFDGYDGRV